MDFHIPVGCLNLQCQGAAGRAKLLRKSGGNPGIKRKPSLRGIGLQSLFSGNNPYAVLTVCG